MKIYLVRHGESTGNVTRIYQPPTTPLSEHGEKQAAIVAKRFRSIPVKIIISSPFTRALQTAQAIKKEIDVPLEQTELLTEIKRPSAIWGKEFHHPEAKQINDMILQNMHDPEYRHSDEETFFDIKDRGKKVLKYLAAQQHNTIAVVTHARFMKMIIAFLTFGDDLTSRQYMQMDRAFHHSNTGVTVCEYTGKKKWVMLTFNDIRHLQEL